MEGDEESTWSCMGHGKPTKRRPKVEVSSEWKCRVWKVGGGKQWPPKLLEGRSCL